MSLQRASLPPPRHRTHTWGPCLAGPYVRPVAIGGSSKTRFGLQLYLFLLRDLAAFPFQPTKHANYTLITPPLPDHAAGPTQAGFPPRLLLHPCERVVVFPRAGTEECSSPPRSPSHRAASAHSAATLRGPVSMFKPRKPQSQAFRLLPVSAFSATLLPCPSPHRASHCPRKAQEGILPKMRVLRKATLGDSSYCPPITPLIKENIT